MSLKLFACGDLVNFNAKENFIDENLKTLISNSDIAICNFEAPIECDEMKTIKKAGPHVYQSKESISYLKEAGFTIVSLANNHIYDYGQGALTATISELNKNKIVYVGAGVDFIETYKPKIIEKNNIKIAFIAGCENEFGCLYEDQKRGGYAWLLHYQIEDSIRNLKGKVDFIVLIAHAGVEDIEIPIKEWRDRYQRLCDIGVNIVVGHHPHVPQGHERYGDSLIFYSLGNFYFDTASFVDKSDDSYSLVLEFDKDHDVEFEIIYHKKINAQTCRVNKQDVSFDLDKLNILLHDGYEKLNDDISVKLFSQYYYGYYAHALGLPSKNMRLFEKIKWMTKKIFFANRDIENRNLLLLHNIRIDSHRFLVQRALSLLSEVKK